MAPWLTSNDQLMSTCVADRSSDDEVESSYRLLLTTGELLRGTIGHEPGCPKCARRTPPGLVLTVTYLVHACVRSVCAVSGLRKCAVGSPTGRMVQPSTTRELFQFSVRSQMVSGDAARKGLARRRIKDSR